MGYQLQRVIFISVNKSIINKSVLNMSIPLREFCISCWTISRLCLACTEKKEEDLMAPRAKKMKPAPAPALAPPTSESESDANRREEALKRIADEEAAAAAVEAEAKRIADEEAAAAAVEAEAKRIADEEAAAAAAAVEAEAKRIADEEAAAAAAAVEAEAKRIAEEEAAAAAVEAKAKRIADEEAAADNSDSGTLAFNDMAAQDTQPACVTSTIVSTKQFETSWQNREDFLNKTGYDFVGCIARRSTEGLLHSGDLFRHYRFGNYVAIWDGEPPSLDEYSNETSLDNLPHGVTFADQILSVEATQDAQDAQLKAEAIEATAKLAADEVEAKRISKEEAAAEAASLDKLPAGVSSGDQIQDAQLEAEAAKLAAAEIEANRISEEEAAAAAAAAAAGAIRWNVIDADNSDSGTLAFNDLEIFSGGKKLVPTKRLQWEADQIRKLENIERNPLAANQVGIMIAGKNRWLTTAHFEHPSNASRMGGCYVLTTPDPYDLFCYFWLEAFSKGFKNPNMERIYFSMCYLRCVNEEGNDFNDKILVGFLRTRCDIPRTDVVIFDNGKLIVVKGEKSASNTFVTHDLKKCWSVPEKEICDALREDIAKLCYDYFTKSRWIYNPKCRVAITTHHPGNFDITVSATTIREMEEQAQMTRGPLANIVSRDILPSERVRTPLEDKLLEIQDQLHQFSSKLEEMKSQRSEDQKQVGEEIETLKSNLKTIRLSLAKKSKATDPDDKALTSLKQKIAENEKKNAENEKQITALKTSMAENRAATVANPVNRGPTSEIEKYYDTHLANLKSVYDQLLDCKDKAAADLLDCKDKAAADVREVLKEQVVAYQARENEKRKRAANREAHEFDEQREKSLADRNVQFMTTLGQIGNISETQARLIELQMSSSNEQQTK
jgi:hypothetical protein